MSNLVHARNASCMETVPSSYYNGAVTLSIRASDESASKSSPLLPSSRIKRAGKLPAAGVSHCERKHRSFRRLRDGTHQNVAEANSSTYKSHVCITLHSRAQVFV